MTKANGLDGACDTHRIVFYPLFISGFVLDAYLFDNHFFNADKIMLSSASSRITYIDMAGNQKMLETIGQHFKENIKSNFGVGITHWKSRGNTATSTILSPRATIFFALHKSKNEAKSGGQKSCKKKCKAPEPIT